MSARKLMSMGIASLLAVSMLVGCGSSAASSAAGSTATSGAATSGTATAEGKGKVYYLNFKPEADTAWQNLAKQYTEETGVPVTVVTAASDSYETTLMSEMAKSDAPTLFQVNGPVGLANWKDYCYDLTGSDIVGNLTSDAYALKDGDAVAGVAYVIESYGLIVNKNILEKAGYTLDDIQSAADLKKVADDLQARKDELGIDGAFTSAGLDDSSAWRFKTHLANLPIYYEYLADKVDDTQEIKGTYLDQYKNIFDLYITDSTTDPTLLTDKKADDSRNEFVDGKAAFYQNGSWEYSELSKTFKDDEIAMIPIYFGVNDETQGLCTGTENYWCVNKNASEDDIQATLAFMNWCVTSETGTKAMANDMGFTIPFKTAQESPNAFVKQDAAYTAAGKTPVSWNFTTMPSEKWKDGLGSALKNYSAGSGSWDDVVNAFVEGWKTEKALSA